MNKLLYILILALLFIIQINASEEKVSENEIVTEYVTEYIDEPVVKEPIAYSNPVKIPNFNVDQLKEFINNNEIVVVGYLDNLNGREYQYLKGVAFSLLKYKDLNFIVTTDNESIAWTTEQIGVQVVKPSFVIFKQGNGYYVPFDKIQTKTMYDVRELCLKALKPYVDELNSPISDFKFDFLLYFYVCEEDKISRINLMQQLAEKYFQEFHVKYIKLEKNPLNISYPELSSKFIIVSKTVQAFYRQSAALSEEDEINFENIVYFVDYYKASLIDPEFLWRLEEMNWEFTDYVTEVRPNIYESVVMDPKTDVIVLYYKSDCPYSQQAMKSFQDLAKHYINQRHKLTVAQFEAETQNIPEISPWRHLIEYPTIVLYPASKNNEKKRLYYVMKNNLGRSAINISTWMLRRANNSYEEISYTAADYDKATKIDGGLVVQDKEEEAKELRTNQLLTDPNLMFTIFGEGKDVKYYSIENEKNNYYLGNTQYSELPMTGTYYELTATTYKVHYSQATNSAKELARANALKRREQQQQQQQNQ